MKLPERVFTDSPAVRKAVPLIVSAMGPSGGGKSYTALRLATGIQRVTGGEIFMVDTEAKRGLHYADDFKFQHVPFDPPFGSLDYIQVIRHCVKRGAKVLILDSLSHEHTGPGGYLDLHDHELDRFAGNDEGKRARNNMRGWIVPARNRGLLIQEIVQLGTKVTPIFCFRAKEKIKPGPKRAQSGGDGEEGGGIINLGWMPLAGEEFLFEATVNFLLMPRADGVATWTSDQVGEKMMMKLPKQFRALLAHRREPLDENVGQQLAEWARGGQPPAAEPAAQLDDAVEGPSNALLDYEIVLADTIDKATSAKELADWWRSDAQKAQRLRLVSAGLTQERLNTLVEKIRRRCEELKRA